MIMIKRYYVTLNLDGDYLNQKKIKKLSFLIEIYFKKTDLIKQT